MSSSVDAAARPPVDVERALVLDGLMPTPEERPLFNRLKVRASVVSCSFSFVLPDGWYSHLDPLSRPGTLSSDRFTALGVFSPEEKIAPPLVISFGAILVPPRGTVAGYFEELCRIEGYEVLARRRASFLCGAVIEGLTRRRTAAGDDVLVRRAMFEDGGRLFGLSGLAPAALFPAAARVIGLALFSFELRWPSGATLPLE
jgi:hypothetical protein